MIHYNNALNPEKFSVPVCYTTAKNAQTTTDKTKVTCKNCLKRFDAGRKLAAGKRS